MLSTHPVANHKGLCYIVIVMAGSGALGEFEQLILLAVIRLGEEAYGVSVRREIELYAERQVSPGALYTTLERLETKGNLTSREGEASPVRGGRAKTFYRVTILGRQRLIASQRAFQRLLAGTKVLEEPHG